MVKPRVPKAEQEIQANSAFSLPNDRAALHADASGLRRDFLKALVFNGARDIRYEDYPDPELRSPNSAILKISSCSICGSDLHMYHGAHIGNTKYGADSPKFCCGHEFLGEIVETGPDVHRFKVGEKVFAAGGTGCGRCAECRTGNAGRCSVATAFGIGPGLEGGQAELVCVPNADATLHSAEGLSDDQAILLTDAMATAYFGLTRAEPKPGDTVAVVGLGPIGLIGVELAFALGAAQVLAIDPVASRRTIAEKLGASR